MADQDLDREYADIKAGVEGIIGDVPSPSGENEEAITNSTEIDSAEAPELPETNYVTENMESTSPASYNEAVDYGSNSQQTQMDTTRLHQIIETVVSEKFDDLTSGLGDLTAWKEKINHDVVSIKQELLRVEEKFENLQNAILGRVKDYDEGIANVHTEMKALEKVLERILEPLVTNVKE